MVCVYIHVLAEKPCSARDIKMFNLVFEKSSLQLDPFVQTTFTKYKILLTSIEEGVVSLELQFIRTTDHSVYKTTKNDHSNYRSFEVQIIRATNHSSYKSFELQIIQATDHSSYRSFKLQIIRATDDHSSYRSFELQIIQSTDHSVYRSFTLQIIQATNHSHYCSLNDL